ncbi:MAG: ABC transporter ATP-binding protein [Planctomycetaceae bacterium]|nr:ABC transporter ATP-binding protein [Planctomycetaceae bacterium]
MKSFARAIALAVRNRPTLLGVIFTSLAVGVLWGANIGVVYPFVEVVFEGQTLQQWIDGEIVASETRADELSTERSQLQETLPHLVASDYLLASNRIEYLRVDGVAERKAAEGYRWVQPYVHAHLPGTPFKTLVLIVGVLIAGTALKDAFLVANLVLVERLVQLAGYDLRKQFFRQTLRLDLASFDDSRNSELLSNFTYDLNGVVLGLNTLFGKALREPLKMLACLIGASFISWRLLLFSLMVSPPALILMQRLSKSIKRANRRAMEEMSLLYNTLTETFTGIQTVKAFTMEGFERNRFHQSAKEFFRKSVKIVFYNSLTKPITEILGIGVISLALVAGAYLVLNQETHLLGIRICDTPMSLGKLLLFYGLLAGVSDPARKLSDVFAALQAGAAAAERIYPVMDREPTIIEPTISRTTARPHHRLVFDNIEFHYQAGQPVLNGVSLEIKYGETIAIVGPNGCGKSTLINMLPRFYDPVRGSIRFDDVDLREMRLRDIRKRVGLVTQQTHLFDDTVLNNIRYGSPNATDAEAMEAAKKAHADRFILDKLEDGYETHVGQSGSRLSGGQRQRIALARAILRDPEVLILDEATSQIDIESEQLIHEALQEFVRDRTAIMITHRLSTLTLADRVVVMDAGRIIDVGTHAELMKRCSLYSRLHEIHFKQSA